MQTQEFGYIDSNYCLILIIIYNHHLKNVFLLLPLLIHCFVRHISFALEIFKESTVQNSKPLYISQQCVFCFVYPIFATLISWPALLMLSSTPTNPLRSPYAHQLVKRWAGMSQCQDYKFPSLRSANNNSAGISWWDLSQAKQFHGIRGGFSFVSS